MTRKRVAPYGRKLTKVPKRPAQYSPEERRRRAQAVRRWEARQKAAGNCIRCGKKRVKGNNWFCKLHKTKTRINMASWRAHNRQRALAIGRKAAAKIRAKRRAARIAAGDPPRKWVQRNPRKPLSLYKWPKKRRRKTGVNG